jgi:hypothetical protein
VGKLTLSRAISDYLAVSRRAAMYSTTEEYLRAEQAAWKRLSLAIKKERRTVVAA